MFMSCWDTGPLCPEAECGNTCSQRPLGLLCLGCLKKGKPSCISLLASRQSLQLAPWRQAWLEPPTSPWQVTGCAWTRHLPGAACEGSSSWACLTACFLESQDRSRTWAYTGRQCESHICCRSAHIRPGWGTCLGLPLQFLSLVVA